jgi:hypothetical protein
MAVNKEEECYDLLHIEEIKTLNDCRDRLIKAVDRRQLTYHDFKR